MLEKLPDMLGHALRDQRAGLDQIAFNRISAGAGTAALQMRSLAFVDHGPIPAQYTADGAGISPPLEWFGVPPGTASLLLIVEDADAPTPHPLVHAIVLDLPPADGTLPEGALKSPDHAGQGYHTGRNSYLRTGWLPPDPPPGHGVHRYCFQLFALDVQPELSGTPGRDAVLDLLRQHAIASGVLIGSYTRADGSIPVAADAVGGTTVTPVADTEPPAGAQPG
ncbi:YbhB/YbcL family Raf kinase inhibitor-like protein [Noviherbaspirillum pedocola]|uniref:YbhB/YbcL family Raf kinase inhibitor-like protein n=1 Tax=Noviherbaspirillum pedocola TaxID=2801341 RepID=A0A934SWV1_9BURK|nr:YbhB/YbcL family Raf kinase inhibitor-like protein [Noviherbaspirillum pedocola]MBK4736551.1 YbhB/YbcL family Raf kinase inhibitor-like protein [Noviherbaspirillum pedocola]